MTQATIEARVPGLREVIAPTAKVIQVATGFASAAGPVCGRVGVMHFSDAARDQVWRYTIPRWKVGADEGEASLARENSGGVRGLTLDHQGRLLCCEATAGRVTREEVDGSVRDCHITSDSIYRYLRQDLVVPFSMEGIAFNVECGDLFIGDLEAGRVEV